MNKIDIRYLQPLLDETLDINNVKNSVRKFNPKNRNSASGHGLTIFGIIASINAKNVVELGVAQGGTTLSLLLATYSNGGFLTCVDKGVFPINLTWVPDLNLPYLQNHIKLIRDDSINFLENYKEEIDLILVDDWHNGEHVFNELELIKTKISKNGIILMHDTMHTNYQPFYNETIQSPESEFGNLGPYGGLKKFIKNNKGWEYSTIPADHGLTILRKVNKK